MTDSYHDTDIEKAIDNDSEDVATTKTCYTTDCDSTHKHLDASKLELELSEAIKEHSTVANKTKSERKCHGPPAVGDYCYSSPTRSSPRSPRRKRAPRSNSILKSMKLPLFDSLTISNGDNNSSSFMTNFISPLTKQLSRVREEEESERRATLFCGFCCDIVKGCIVMNSVTICLMTLFFGFFLFYRELVGELSAVNEDGEPDPILRALALAKTGLLIPVGVLGIVGARTFHKGMVLFVAIWYGIDVIPGFLMQTWTIVLLSSFGCYAHVHLYIELKSGRITSDNYRRTEQHCCCFSSC